ncbi:MAG: PilT/PilU family type 4a pilus ATPase [Deltaproteobacteria bacterium]|nr:PilT/PilU family type 4a pilus ATPase [Deltaproteobacteria bacterium]
MHIHGLFDRLLARNGSDLHLAPGYPPMMRVRGDLVAEDQPPLEPEDVQALLSGLLTAEQQRTFTATGDLDFAYAYGGKARFRGNLMRKLAGVGAVFRAIPTKILTLDQLDVPDGLRRLTELERGLVLVAGPTGGGKSTTLAAMLDHINATRTGHILTIEDPIEFVHAPRSCLITHKEVGDHVPSVAEALRGAGREDADVILVGELHGAEAIRLALELASSGGLVLAAIRAGSASAAIERCIDAFPADQQAQIRNRLADALAGVLAQQLLERADGAGRIAVHEVVIGDAALASLIREGDTAQLASAIRTGAAGGAQALDATLDRLVREGIVTAGDALEAALDRDAFAKLPHVAHELTELA